MPGPDFSTVKSPTNPFLDKFERLITAVEDVSAASSGVVVSTQSISLAASEDLAAFVAATVTGKNGNSANSAHYGKIVGITTEAIATGFTGPVVTFGIITNSGWSWTAGSSIFLNGTSLSQTAPSTGFSQVIGVAKGTDTILVSLSDPVLL